MKFEDHFSHNAGKYARHRPRYPGELFAYLASIAPANELAWDCGTGNGQAALVLANHFKHVVATDASPEQIGEALAHERIEYRIERAENVSIETGTVDLITVATAVHWFDLEVFYAAAYRVLKPNGVLAVWAYHLPLIAPPVDRILLKYYSEVLKGYWPERFDYLDKKYKTLPFPLEEENAPAFVMEADWNLSELAGFLDSWSATQKFREKEGHHPLQEVWDELVRGWGEPGRQRKIRWPLNMRVGRPRASTPYNQTHG